MLAVATVLAAMSVSLATDARADTEQVVITPIWPYSSAFIGPGAQEFSFAVNGGAGPIHVTCTIDDGFWMKLRPCSSPFIAPNLSDGPHVLHYRAVDAEGQESDEFVHFFTHGASPAPDPPAPLAWDDPQCAAVKLIGVAGSGENGGPGTDNEFEPSLGKPVSEFERELRERIEATLGVGAMANYQALDYPAVPVGFDNGVTIRNSIQAELNTGEYDASVRDGEGALKNAINAYLNSGCAGRTHLVLAGYSQGAQVIGNVLERWPEMFPRKHRSSIGTVVLFGDPKFNPGASSVHLKSTFFRWHAGILEPRERAALRGFKVLSFCHRDDPICQDTSVMNGHPHNTYHLADATWAANELGWYIPTAIGRLAREDVPALNVHIGHYRHPSVNAEVLSCRINDAQTGLIALDTTTCMMRGRAIVRMGGGGEHGFTHSIPFDLLDFADNGVPTDSVNLQPLLDAVPPCIPFFIDCSKRRVKVVIEVSATASASGHLEYRSPQRQAFTVIDRRG